MTLEAQPQGAAHSLQRADELLSAAQSVAMNALVKQRPGDDLSECENVLPLVLLSYGNVKEVRSSVVYLRATIVVFLDLPIDVENNSLETRKT